MENLRPYYDLVDSSLIKMGIDPATCRVAGKPAQWDLKRGSASVWIDILWDEKAGAAYFQCMAPVIKVPTSAREVFYEEVLTLGHNLYGCGFTLFQGYIYVKTLREVDGLDANEISATLTRIGYYADTYDDYLRDRYFGAPA